EGEQVHGLYEAGGRATVEGQDQQGRLVFRYREPRIAGEGYFDLGDSGMDFAGQWRPDGVDSWSDWIGRRRLPRQGLTWIVVLEANWQRHLAESEYAYGDMVREFFARVNGVEVRHRFFTDEASLDKWSRELLYLQEPTILMLAAHGTAEGLAAHGQIIK